ncbi:MAG: aminotransferase class III-fold pyridoxal phosphate-dependent enzyme, partial [Leptospiraceae bacterium]|nr:aminotransferase class III-fold pyridoxal phosphate-dependent enzyme [Leptospiraceae bacterium]
MGLQQNKSEQLYQRAIQVIPGGVNSPVRAFRSVGGTPVFMESGSGCRITDADGNSYVDFCNSWGPLIFGHRPSVVMEAVRTQLDKALTLGTPCQAEVEIAEYVVSELRKRVSSIERIRFVNSGTEAVMSALRLARGFTGRNKIIKFDGCYHGHSDSLLVKAGSGLATAGIPDSHGVPTEFTAGTIVLPLDDESALQQAFQQHGSDLAAVIIEAIPANNGLLLQRPEYLQKLQEICRNYDTLLIVDEVIS